MLDVNKLIDAFSVALEETFEEIEFPLECLDWLSYNPDYHIKKYNELIK